MGIDTGADKYVEITKDGEVFFKGYYDTLEGKNLKYPNGEFVYLANTISELSKEGINVRKYLIWDEVDYEDPSYCYERIRKQLADYTFEKAIREGEKARKFIEENYEEVKKNYRYSFRHEPLVVLDYLIDLWKKGYYVNYS